MKLMWRLDRLIQLINLCSVKIILFKDDHIVVICKVYYMFWYQVVSYYASSYDLRCNMT